MNNLYSYGHVSAFGQNNIPGSLACCCKPPYTVTPGFAIEEAFRQFASAAFILVQVNQNDIQFFATCQSGAIGALQTALGSNLPQFWMKPLSGQNGYKVQWAMDSKQDWPAWAESKTNDIVVPTLPRWSVGAIVNYLGGAFAKAGETPVLIVDQRDGGLLRVCLPASPPDFSNVTPPSDGIGVNMTKPETPVMDT